MPLALLLVPWAGGLLALEGAVPGVLALPGGLYEFGESWQEFLVRRLREDLGVDAPAERVRDFGISSDVPGGLLVVVGILEGLEGATIPEPTDTPSSVRIVVLHAPREMGSPSATWAVREYFARLTPPLEETPSHGPAS